MKPIVVVGPTATGKSALAVELALSVGGEVISADSRQVYRGLDIGTGKVTLDEMRGVPHHMLDVAEPMQVYSVHDYVADARAVLNDVQARGKVPIICGGTGLYVDMLLGRMSMPSIAPNEALRAELERYSLEELNAKLNELDSARHATIDHKNPRRLIRAIEIATARIANDTASAAPTAPSAGMIYRTEQAMPIAARWVGLTAPADVLRARITARLDARLAVGMLDECTRLLQEGVTHERLHALGLEYRYMSAHLRGKLSYDEMRAELLKEIPRYARRQKTWFKRNPLIEWYDATHPELALVA